MTMSDAFVYLVLQRQLNFAAGSFPLLYVLTSLGFLLLAIPAGRIADRVGRFPGVRRRLRSADPAVCAADLGAARAWPCWWSSCFLLSAYYAATEGVLMALGSAVLPDAVRTTGLAVLTTATALARLGASLVFGVVWMRIGDQAGGFGIHGGAGGRDHARAGRAASRGACACLTTDVASWPSPS